MTRLSSQFFAFQDYLKHDKIVIYVYFIYRNNDGAQAMIFLPIATLETNLEDCF